MASELYIPWRDDRGPESLTDIEILEWIDSNGRATPRQISEMRRRESEIRLQCRYLAKSNLLLPLGNETFELSNRGRAFLSEDVSLPHSDGYFDLTELFELPDARIQDLTMLTQRKIKERNSFFYEKANDPSAELPHDYSVDVRDPRLKRKKVWSAKAWKLDRLLRELPSFENVVSQCAHWMRAIAGLHLFPDANHRTGMATLSELMFGNEIIEVDHPWPGDQRDIGKAVLLSKFHRYLSAKVTFSTLWRQDTLYWHWRQYFDYLLNGYHYPALNKHSEGHLRAKLNDLRKKRRG